jgi:cytochrome bd ubiquinol oxidase subunit II
VAGCIVFAGLYPITHDAPTLSHGLLDRALPLLAVAAIAGVTTLALVYRRNYSPARISAVVAVAVVVLGWGIGQYPWVLVDQLTIEGAAGAEATLAGLLVIVAIAVVVVLPAFTYLLRLTQTEKWSRA